MQGSPPRMRGKGGLTGGPCCGSRITPAYAGKSRGRRQIPESGQDHPRVCGEKASARALTAWMLGSPPHMRGKGSLGRGDHALRGITPAYAGKRPDGDRLPAERQDHPRVCGEKAALPILLRYHRGSPPRVRGKAS